MAKRTKKAAPKTETVPAVVAVPAEHRPETHSFAYRDGASCMTCLCGAEQELRLVDGKAARMYRASSAVPWCRAIDVCSQYVPPAPPKAEEPASPWQMEPVQMMPGLDFNEPRIPEDDYARPDPDAPPNRDPTLLESFEKALKEQYPEAFAPEIVDGSDVEKTAEMVDLDIECSPVLPHRSPTDPLSGPGDTLIPVECSALGEGMYRIYYPEGPRDVPADTVKRMRARFLLRRGELSRALIEKDGDPVVKQRWMKLYRIPSVPPAGSPLAAMMQGRVRMISIPRDGDAPVDFAAVMKALSTPGGEVPKVCPTLPANEPTADKAAG